MKIHKIDSKRIYFTMDSGAYGSISKEDVDKLKYAKDYQLTGKIDPRENTCLVEKSQAERIRFYDKLLKEKY